MSQISRIGLFLVHLPGGPFVSNVGLQRTLLLVMSIEFALLSERPIWQKPWTALQRRSQGQSTLLPQKKIPLGNPLLLFFLFLFLPGKAWISFPPQVLNPQNSWSSLPHNERRYSNLSEWGDACSHLQPFGSKMWYFEVTSWNFGFCLYSHFIL